MAADIRRLGHDTEFNNAELRRGEVRRRRRRGPYNRDNQRRRAAISPRLRPTLLHGRATPRAKRTIGGIIGSRRVLVQKGIECALSGRSDLPRSGQRYRSEGIRS